MIQLNSKENKIWFTSDTHFCHKNIINFCERPYGSIEEMNKALIDNWNERVGDNDIIFHLGDVAFCYDWSNILSQLKGRKFLVLGNHDKYYNRGKNASFFEAITPKIVANIDGRTVYMNHEPLLTFSGIFNGQSINLFGHVHTQEGITNGDSERLKILSPYHYDVGVDNNNYYPVSWEEVQEIIKKQKEKFMEERLARPLIGES